MREVADVPRESWQRDTRQCRGIRPLLVILAMQRRLACMINVRRTCPDWPIPWRSFALTLTLANMQKGALGICLVGM